MVLRIIFLFWKASDFTGINVEVHHTHNPSVSKHRAQESIISSRSNETQTIEALSKKQNTVFLSQPPPMFKSEQGKSLDDCLK